MKAFAALILFTLLGTGTGAGAQTAAWPANPDAERARIASERARLESVYLTEDAACYQRFFVNNCLDDVNVKRRESMATLRTQEIVLNEEERKFRGAEQIRRIEEKSSAENQQREADQRAKAAADERSRLEGQKEKQQSRTKAQAAEQANSEARAGRLQANQLKEQARVNRQAAESAEAARYNARQREAEERRAQNAREQLQRAKPAAKPLPLPQQLP
jgi:colicin import membrane protein